MILVIDNYDSFTYNLVQYLAEVTGELEDIKVFRNDKISIDTITNLNPRIIVISPGPCTPNEAGISLEVIKKLKGEIPILGVCLGHQAIGQAFGAQVIRAQKVFHGKTSKIKHTNESIFKNLPQNFRATRYHSLIIDQETLPRELLPIAWSEDGVIMAVVSRDYPNIIGLQFHPESILTETGKLLLKAFTDGNY